MYQKRTGNTGELLSELKASKQLLPIRKLGDKWHSENEGDLRGGDD